MPAEMAGMTDEAEVLEALGADPSDGRKGALRARADRGVQVEVRPVRRREWPDADKVRVVRESLQPGAVVQAVADRNGVSTGQLYTWRKEMLAAAVSGFAPVAVVPEAPRVAGPAPAREGVAEAAGVIEIGLPSGATVRASGRVDMAVLRVVLAELGGP
ncbi:IS66-like element accessory protein TnpA [Roseomonas chloroacetimidivorans]|uniref:IS66-like element accessory protein TnpA n=1 Tax=Roseomonas chloroacetimidivorans TaxID=1766656 RepID=UPI003C7498C0